MNDDLKILIVDDTVVYRQILSSIVSDIQETELLGTAPNGKIALSKIESGMKPDLVLLDVSMPVMDGIETLKAIKDSYENIEVIMVSGSDTGNANLTMKALDIGAIDFIPKPQGASPEESLRTLRTSLNPLISLVRTRKYSRQTKQMSSGRTVMVPPPEKTVEKPSAEPIVVKKPPPKPSTGVRKPPRIDVIALGVSTGGPNALQQVIPALPGNLPVPVIAVQHMPPTFTASLAHRLDKDSKITVVEGQEGMPVEAGYMYIAPGGLHMVVRKEGTKKVLGIVDSPPVNSCKPSVDVLFRSMAMIYGGNTLSVILTGMGNDGAAGVAAIRRKGGYSIVQDEKTSVVWGMPYAVVDAGEADEIVPLDRVAPRIMRIVG